MIKELISLFFNRLFISVLLLVLDIFLARYSDFEFKGVFNYVSSFSITLGLVLTAGLHFKFIFGDAKYPDYRQNQMSTDLIGLNILGLGFIGALVVYSLFKELVINVWALWLTVYAESIFCYLSFFSFRLFSQKTYMRIRNIKYISQIIILMIFFFLFKNYNISIIFTIISIFSLALSYAIIIWGYSKYKIKFAWVKPNKEFVTGLKVGFSNMSIVFIDRFLYRGAVLISGYFSMNKLTSNLMIALGLADLSISFSDILGLKLIGEKEKGEKVLKNKELLGLILYVNFILSFILVIATSISGYLFIPILFGKDYVTAVPLLLILLPGYLLNSNYKFSQRILNLNGKSSKILPISIFASIFILIMSLATYKINYYSIALSFSIGFALQGIAITYLVRKHFDIKGFHLYSPREAFRVLKSL